ncbi:hypothetical protein R1sor_000223 [Riccia sorocarpa]|uniref:ZSWIM1/3 RNaseH-like domain-containing protein n=1 Tax=Riccia sorocarpa TaxID=122646 RepID=A0ABD3GUH0_9MARC
MDDSEIVLDGENIEVHGDDVCMEAPIGNNTAIGKFQKYELLQEPPAGFFNSDNLVWHPVKKGGRTGGDREEAWIPYERLKDFVNAAEIIAEHQQRIAEVVRNVKDGQKMSWTRDMQLTPLDIRNIQARLRKKGQLYHPNDAEAVRQWTQRFPDHVIHYQEQNNEKGKPFCLVFTTPWMLRNFAIYGHGRAVALDATHGTNMYGFQLFTWVVYDNHQNGLPVVWALLERHRTEDLETVQRKIKEKVQKEYPEITSGNFRPSCFITDDCAEEKSSIRYQHNQPCDSG